MKKLGIILLLLMLWSCTLFEKKIEEEKVIIKKNKIEKIEDKTMSYNNKLKKEKEELKIKKIDIKNKKELEKKYFLKKIEENKREPINIENFIKSKWTVLSNIKNKTIIRKEKIRLDQNTIYSPNFLNNLKKLKKIFYIKDFKSSEEKKFQTNQNEKVKSIIDWKILEAKNKFIEPSFFFLEASKSYEKNENGYYLYDKEKYSKLEKEWKENLKIDKIRNWLKKINKVNYEYLYFKEWNVKYYIPWNYEDIHSLLTKFKNIKYKYFSINKNINVISNYVIWEDSISSNKIKDYIIVKNLELLKDNSFFILEAFKYLDFDSSWSKEYLKNNLKIIDTNPLPPKEIIEIGKIKLDNASKKKTYIYIAEFYKQVLNPIHYFIEDTNLIDKINWEK